METFGSLWMILLLGVYYVSTDDSNCTFPSYAQNEPNDATDYWEFNDGISRNPVAMTFQGGEWIAVSEGEVAINSTCVKQQGSENSNDSWSDIFIIKSNSGNESLGSMCLQFINRTSNVVQIKTAKAVESGENFTCNSTLELVDRPLLANKRRTIHYQRCPFEGGYNLYNLATITGKNEEALCGNFPIQGLLESECTTGEGLQLMFTDYTCIPKYTGWGREQLLYCLDSWKNENETQFSVLGSTYDNPEFCMVMTDDDQFIIFQDMICTDGVPPNTTTYITMDYVKKETSFDICEDEEDMVDCRETKFCQDLPFKLSCRKSCGACYPNDSCQYDESTVPQEGQWVMQRDVELHSLVSATFDFQPSTFNVEEFTQFNCHKKVLDDTYLNHLNVSQGCSSRYACTKFSRVSPSVLQYKFSRFERDYEETTDLCQDNNFIDDDEPLKNIIRSRDYNILIAQNETLNETVDCSFYGIYTINMSLHWDTISCTGSLSDLQHCEHHDTLSVEVLCEGKNHKEEYPCIGTIDFGSTSTRVLITRAPKDHSTVGHCWVLKSPEDETSPLQFYVLNSPQCDVSTLESIETGTRHAEANVTAHRVDTCDETSKPGMSTTMPEVSGTPDNIITNEITGDFKTEITEGITKGVPDDATVHSTVFTTEVDESAPTKGPDYGPSAGRVIGILFGVIAGCLLVSVVAWFGVKEYRKRKSPYRVL